MRYRRNEIYTRAILGNDWGTKMMNVNVAKFAKTALALALVVSGAAHAGTSSQSVAKQLSAVSTKGGVVAQPAISLPPLNQQDLKAFYTSLPSASRKVLVATYKALPSSIQTRYRQFYRDLPVSPA